jgi:FkbM family methyltransferase
MTFPIHLHERAVIQWAMAEAFPMRCAVDVGAHHGTWAVALLQACSRLVCIEPNPEAFAVLKINLAHAMTTTQSPAAIHLHQCAAGAEHSVKRMNLYACDAHGTLLPEHPIPQSCGKMLSMIEVRVNRLDDMIGSCDFIKVDTEGYELEVVAGAQDIIAQSNPLWMIECYSVDTFANLRARMGVGAKQTEYGAGRYLLGRLGRT